MAKQLLVVDDNPEALESLAALLETANYRIMRASNAREALDLLDERNDIDLVVSDVRMPEVDGFDFARVLRSRFPSLPIVLITGLPVTDEDVIPRNVTIVHKPFAISDLIRTIEETATAAERRNH